MRILYIGQPGTERVQRWTSFLTEEVGATTVASVVDLGSLDFTGFDLALVDGDPYLDTLPPEVLRVGDLPLPTVLVGGVGGLVSDAIGLKLGWAFGCLCLSQEAILTGAEQQHPIFHGPHDVPAPDVRTTPTSAEFLLSSGFKTVPAELTLTDIYIPRDEDLAEDAAPGLVSTGAGFSDSPDTEHILGGINSKSHDYNAIARQGRFLQWGFAGDPTKFTPFGRALFLNAVAYIRKFADAPVQALVMGQHPRAFLQFTLSLLHHPDAGDVDELLGHLFDDVPEGIGVTGASGSAWFDRHRDAIRFTGVRENGRYSVDGDILSIGIANDDLALLDRISAELGDPDADGERARRLWSRYVRRDPQDATREREWYRAHRDALFFSDWAGYRWFASDELPALERPRVGIARGAGAFLSLAAERTESGIQADLTIRLKPGDYVYAPGATDGVPTAIAVTSEHAVVSAPLFPETATHHLPGTLTIPLVLAGDADRVELDVRLQVCTPQTCMMPTTVSVWADTGSALSPVG